MPADSQTIQAALRVLHKQLAEITRVIEHLERLVKEQQANAPVDSGK